MQTVSNGWFEFLVFLLALLFAVQGFSWLDSRRKLDLYLSVPVSTRRRFAVVYRNGAAVFAVCYFVMLLLALPAAAVMGAPFQRTSPEVGESTPMMIRMAVVLPAPLPPTKPVNWPSGTSKSRRS